MKICFLGMLLCWTLRKLSNIFTLETARYVTEQIVIAFGDNFSNKLKLMFVCVTKSVQVAGTSLQSFLCLARTLGLPEFVEQASSQDPESCIFYFLSDQCLPLSVSISSDVEDLNLSNLPKQTYHIKSSKPT